MAKRIVLALALLIVAVVAWRAYRAYHDSYEVERTDDGVALAKVVTERLNRAAELRVSTLSGIVQATSSDTRGFGMLRSDRVYKAPYTVDYFIDAGAIDPAHMRWNAKSRTLLVDAPDVMVAPPNVDEARATVVETRGLFITRDAFEELRRRGSLRAQRVVGERARDPANLTRARDNARAALRNLLAAPLQAAGMGDVTVVVRFPYEGRRDDRRWDVSRSLEEVLANAT